MKKEHIEYFYQEAKYLSWDKFQECFVKPTDTYEECRSKVSTVTNCFSSEDDNAWDYFTAIYNDIPIQYRMQIMLEEIYANYKVNYPMMLQYISHYICAEETEDLKKRRIEQNKEILKDFMREDEKVKLHRGLAEYFLMPEYAVSYTTDKNVADFFVKYHKSRHGSRFGVSMWNMFDIEDILYYSNVRNEKEAFVIPRVIKEGYLPKTWHDIDYLDESNMRICFWWANDIEIVEALYEEEYGDDIQCAC